MTRLSLKRSPPRAAGDRGTQRASVPGKPAGCEPRRESIPVVGRILALGRNMFRESIAASAAVLVLGACPVAPQAAAAEGDQVIRVQDGQLRCLLSADYKGRGYQMAVCGRSDGRGFAASPMSTGKYPERLNLIVARGTGESWWEAGAVPGSASGDVVLGPGQTFAANGWTVTTEDLRIVIKNDTSGHGLQVNALDVRQF